MARRAGFRETLTARVHGCAMRGRQCLLGRFVGIVALAALTGCRFVSIDGENPALCAQPDYVSALRGGVDRIDVHELNFSTVGDFQSIIADGSGGSIITLQSGVSVHVEGITPVELGDDDFIF